MQVRRVELGKNRVEWKREWVAWQGERMKWEGVAAVGVHLEVVGEGVAAVKVVGVHLEVGGEWVAAAGVPPEVEGQLMEGEGAGSAVLGHSGSEPDRVQRTPRPAIRRRGCCSRCSCPGPTQRTGTCMRR